MAYPSEALKRRKTPPQLLPSFADTIESIEAQTKASIDARRQCLNHVASSQTPETAKFQNTVEAIALNSDEASLATRKILFYSKVSPDAEIRQAASKARQATNEFNNESMKRSDIFSLVSALYTKRDSLDLGGEDMRLLEQRYRDYKLNGLGLAAGSEEQKRLRQVKARIASLKNTFRQNLNEESGGIWLTLEDLDGVPSDVLIDLEKGSGAQQDKLRVTFENHHVQAVMKYAKLPETRRASLIANENKCNDNTAIFQETLKLRKEYASLLGFQSYADLAAQDKMANNTVRVQDFIDDLRQGLTPLAARELEHLKQLKSEELASRGLQNDGKFYVWDYKYYARLLFDTEYQVDEREISEYFSVDKTVDGMLRIYESVMGFVFIRLDSEAKACLSPTGKAEDVVWHEDNIIFSVWDEDELGGGFLGYLYMDLYPRPGKYSHCCNTNFQPGLTRRDGSRQYPVTALICNFSPPQEDKPSLLKHQEVITLFHELGHGIHSLAAKTKYGRFHGTAVEWDFVEAPSQMLEEWCWSPSVLKSLSSHWETGQQIPDSLIDRLVATEKVNQAIDNLIQVQYSLFDYTCHVPKSQEEVAAIDPCSLFNTGRESVTMMSGLENSDWAHGDAIFGHLMSGYEATYYGYLWSKVFSIDMFESVFRKNPMDGAHGRRYRRTVLEPGGSRGALESVTEFLGREPNTKAFYSYLGISSVDY